MRLEVDNGCLIQICYSNWCLDVSLLDILKKKNLLCTANIVCGPNWGLSAVRQLRIEANEFKLSL